MLSCDLTRKYAAPVPTYYTAVRLAINCAAQLSATLTLTLSSNFLAQKLAVLYGKNVCKNFGFLPFFLFELKAFTKQTSGRTGGHTYRRTRLVMRLIKTAA